MRINAVISTVCIVKKQKIKNFPQLSVTVPPVKSFELNSIFVLFQMQN